MDNPYSASDADEFSSWEETLLFLPWIGRVRITLMVIGLFNLLASVSVPVMYYFIGLNDMGHQGALMMAGFGVVVGLIVAVMGVVPAFVAAWGLGKGKKWAWFVALILGAMYVPSICFPVGGIILYGLLQDDVRKAFLG